MEDQVARGAARLVILEMGCGVRCPSVRRECEEVLGDCLRRHAEESAAQEGAGERGAAGSDGADGGDCG